LDPYIRSRDQRTIQGIETQWFPASKEVQDSDVIKQGVGVCLSGQRLNFACRLLEKGATITVKCYVALLDKFKQHLVSKRRDKLSKEILFLEDNTAPHKAAIIHEKLVDLHFEILKHPAFSPDLVPSEYEHYLLPQEIPQGKKVFDH
jgi:hypothetical protein